MAAYLLAYYYLSIYLKMYFRNSTNVSIVHVLVLLHLDSEEGPDQRRLEVRNTVVLGADLGANLVNAVRLSQS
jgi:hypothetical protein